MTIEEFLELRFFDVNSILRANQKKVKEYYIPLETIANIVGKTGFTQLKEDIRFFKEETKVEVNEKEYTAYLKGMDIIKQHYSN